VTDGPPPPDVPPGPVRVFNRSDRVWVYGYVRMAPLVILFGGIALLLFLNQQLRRLPDGVAISVLFVCFVGPFVLDRLPPLNPVNYLWLTDAIRVVRLAGRPRDYLPQRVVGIELAPREGEEYDDRQPSRGGMDVTIRFRRAWPATLLVSPEDARQLADWARRRGAAVTEPII
jgi:hypothetical protein